MTTPIFESHERKVFVFVLKSSMSMISIRVRRVIGSFVENGGVSAKMNVTRKINPKH
jgi:hypothetical protein